MAGLARHGIKVSAAAVDRVRAPRRGVVVLLYHRVDGASGSQVDLPVNLFESQIAELAESGRATTIDSALETLQSAQPPVVDPVVVTFDDGTADFADAAMSILERHRVPVTLYLSTDFVERARSFPGDGQPLSWPALADAVSTGLVTVGSHTHTHALLDRCPPSVVQEELDRSIELIRERLGVEAQHFAYPKGLAGSPAAQEAVRSRFRSAALGGCRANQYGAFDRYRVARSPIQVSDGMRFFRHKLAGGMALEETLRRALARVRYARARV